MKVIAINLSTSGKTVGGASIACELHTAHIKKQGVDIELWRMWSNDGIDCINGLNIKSFKTKSLLNILKKVLPKRIISIFMYSNITKELLKIKPDIVHLHNILPSFELLRICKICKKNKIKIVITTHGFYECFYPAYNFSLLEKYLWKFLVTFPVKKSFKFIDVFFSLYPMEAELLKKNKIKSGDIYLVPNGVDPFYETKPTKIEINNVLKKFNINPNNPILFFTGNHTSNKGLDTIKELSRFLNIKSTILIGGKLLNQEEPKLFCQGLKNKNLKIIFTDFLSVSEQRAIYNVASILLFPSKSDTLPLTIIEAMACSLPVVAFDVGGISFLLNKDCGYLIDPNNTKKYLETITKLLKNKFELEKTSNKALARQKKLFSWTKAGSKAKKIYETLMVNSSIPKD